MNKQKEYPVVGAQMLIRKPVEDVFEAMVNPGITSKFWFTKSSGWVESGKTLEWEWGQFGVKDTVDILEVKPNKYISLNWSIGELATIVEISFEEHSDQSTLVKVRGEDFGKPNPLMISNWKKK